MMKYLFLLLLSVIMLSATCSKDLVKTSFSVKNNSSKTLYYATSDKYPDTAVAEILYQLPIDPFQTGGPFLYLPSPTSGIVEIFLFDSAVVTSVPSWDSITARYMILKRYDLTTDSIDKMARLISYP